MTVVADDPTTAAESASRLGVMARMTLILEAFTDGPERLSLEEITHITGLPRSTVFRILRQLVELHWVEHGSRGYQLGPRLVALGATKTRNDEVRAAASVPLTELQLATDAVVHLSVLEAPTVHYLDKVGGSVAATVPSRVGARILAPDTVSGRAILAFLPAEQVDRALALCRPGARIDVRELHRALTHVRHRGGVAHSSSVGRSSGISSLAAPVLGPNGPVAAISVATRGEFRVENVTPLVLSAARGISHALFGERLTTTIRGTRRSPRAVHHLGRR